MTTFVKNNAARDPFGKNAFLRSTKDVKTDSYTFYKGGIPSVLVDGNATKILQPGTVIAKIISGPGTGMVGVFQGVGADEVHTLNPSSGAGDWASGTFNLTVLGFQTDEIAYNANAATIQAAIRAAVAAGDIAGDYDDITITVTGGPFSANTDVVITFNGTIGVDVAVTVFDGTNLADGDSTVAVTTTTAGSAGATDGRGDTANIVGICDTFLPWQLTERDVEISVVYEATVVQAWCIEYDAAGEPTALGNTTRDAMIALAATKNISYK
jgi:hypothetical protein